MNSFIYDEASALVSSGGFGTGNGVVIGNNPNLGGSMSALTIKKPSDSYMEAINTIKGSTKTPVVGYSFVNQLGKRCTASIYQWNRMQKYFLEDLKVTDIQPILADNMTAEQAMKWAVAGSYEQNFRNLIS